MVTIDHLCFALTLFAVLGCGMLTGVFFAFSAFVMNTLAHLPSAQGITTMQSINVEVITQKRRVYVWKRCE